MVELIGIVIVVAPVMNVACRKSDPTIGSRVFKLNTNGSSIGNKGKGGASTSIRNDRGKLIGGCFRHILLVTSVKALLWAISDGLALALQHNIAHLEFESDATTDVSCICNSETNNLVSSTLVNGCRSLMSKFISTSLKHIYKDGNQCANQLARLENIFQQDNQSTVSNRNICAFVGNP
ncbi:hypothetical protein Goshw_005923 [Gossypium schwendimanii]|uniref:RNase H type-1 domain-containing protein n=1 Tax=Gossypium schwendimanii TaxID=34291 RepID=A0A7J9NAS4_GOSSC|nr:hypothetical protein [Gossypium schwendimanii]